MWAGGSQGVAMEAAEMAAVGGVKVEVAAVEDSAATRSWSIAHTVPTIPAAHPELGTSQSTSTSCLRRLPGRRLPGTPVH